jgi:hypothetical protein
LGEGRGNAFIVFLMGGKKGIAVDARNSREVRELQRKQYQNSKWGLRKLLCFSVFFQMFRKKTELRINMMVSLYVLKGGVPIPSWDDYFVHRKDK